MKRVDVVPAVAAGIAGLGEHGEATAVGQPERVWISEAAHTPIRAEVVVEGAVLLDQDHDVLDVVQRPAPR